MLRPMPSPKELAAKLTELERKVAGHDGHIRSLFEAIRQLMNQSAAPGAPDRIRGEILHSRQPERVSQMNRSRRLDRQSQRAVRAGG